MGCGVLVTAHGLVPEDSFAFNSEHPSIVQFSFADGAVRPISTAIDLTSLYRASGKHDGEQLNWVLAK
jgi:hypothetical protein